MFERMEQRNRVYYGQLLGSFSVIAKSGTCLLSSKPHLFSARSLVFGVMRWEMNVHLFHPANFSGPSSLFAIMDSYCTTAKTASVKAGIMLKTAKLTPL